MNLKSMIYISGIVSIVFISITLLLRIINIIIKICSRKKIHLKGGPMAWAVVTGSTDGIGLEYAKQLYEKDYNLLLISRNPQKLKRVEEYIYLKYGRKRCVRTFVIDFCENTEIMYTKISDELDLLPQIDILVNNVSICYPEERPERFTKINNINLFINNIINANIVSCTRLTAMVLPKMESKNRGIIINISSLSAKCLVPYLTLYSATKVFIDYFSRSLSDEYKNSGIFIQSLLPYYVSTKMAHHKKPSFWVPTPEIYVKNALGTVGYHHRTTAYLSHRFLDFLIDFGNTNHLLNGFNWNKIFFSYRIQNTMKRIESNKTLSC